MIFKRLFHAFVCAFFIALIASITSVTCAVITTVLIASFKEVIDYCQTKEFDWLDLLSDIAGIIIGTLLWLL